MQVVITGVAGFIGSNLAKRLLNHGHSVIGIDALTDDAPKEIKEFRLKELSNFYKLEFIKLDILNNGMFSILGKRTCDYFIHLASKDTYYHRSRESDTYSDFFEINTLGSIKMYELAFLMKAKKFMSSSTFSVYGNTKKEVLSERKLVPNPVSPHGASKVAMEVALKYLNHQYHLPCIIPRIFSVYGPNMPTHTFVYQTVSSALKNIPLVMRDDFTKQKRDFIFIEDVVDMLEISLSKRLNYQIINIASGESTPLPEIMRIVDEEVGTKLSRNPNDDRAGLQKVLIESVHADTKKAEKILKYKAHTSLKEGLSQTVNWYKSNPEFLKYAYRR